MIICLDPGHGGDATGNVQVGFVEKDFNLAFALDLRCRLLDSDWPVSVAMTRVIDEFVSQGDRARISQDCAADFVLSIHVDANPDSRLRGPRIYRREGGVLGNVFARGFSAHNNRPCEYAIGDRTYTYTSSSIVTRSDYRHWTNRAHTVLRSHDRDKVALIECAVATNPGDLTWLLSDEGRDEISKSVIAGLRDVVQLKHPDVAL